MGQCEHGLFSCDICEARDRKEQYVIDIEAELAAIQEELRKAKGLLAQVPHSLSAEMEGLDKDIEAFLTPAQVQAIIKEGE
jgi:hypothetical protein